MRFSVALVAMATAAFASADRLIYIPTARKIPFGEVKLEYRAEPRVQGEVERYKRVAAMVTQADAEGFGSCSNEGECEAVCPKEIPISNIARMSREFTRAVLAGK